MKSSKIAAVAALAFALSSTANAQFSESGGGSSIPSSGTGGDAAFAGDGGALYDTVQAGIEATSSVNVANAVTSITSIEIQGLSHTWVGDTQATLEDPAGVEHLIWLRPGFLNTGNFGSSGDFDGGNYTFVDDGSGASMQTTSGANNLPAGTYNQSFGSGGINWISGTNGINNTAMSSITGPAGAWTLHIYDWAGGDSGSFSGWTLNGTNGGGTNSGSGYCYGDGLPLGGTSSGCPCSNGGPGEGCLTSSGSGAALTGSGNADVGADTFGLNIAGAPAGKPGVFFQGTTQVTNPLGNGIMCTNSTSRYPVQFVSGAGTVSISGLGSNAAIGASMNYQYWFRDPSDSCGGGFNFSNGWNVTWL